MKILILLALVMVSLGHGYAAGDSMIALTQQVNDYGDFVKRATSNYRPGHLLELYMSAEEVNHRGFVATDFVISIYDPEGRLVYLKDYRVRLKNYTRNIYVVHRFKIPEDWRLGEYYLWVTAYDRVNEEKLGEIYSSGREVLWPDTAAAEKFLGAPTGINVEDADYESAGVLRPRDYKSYLYTRYVRFTLTPTAELIYLKPISARAFFTPEEGTSYFTGNPILYLEAANVSRGGFTAVDFIVTLMDSNFTPLNLSEYRVRYKGRNQSLRLLHEVNVSGLPEGTYYVDVKIYDRANEKKMKEIKNLEKFEAEDIQNLKKFTEAEEGINVEDDDYRDVGVLLPRDFTSLGFYQVLEFRVFREEAPPTAPPVRPPYPTLAFNSIDTSKTRLAPGESFLVRINTTNLGGAGEVELVLEITGREKSYKIPLAAAFDEGETKIITHNVTLFLEEGVWRLGVQGSALLKTVFVFEAAPGEVEEEALMPEEKPKSIYVIALLLMLLIPIITFRVLLKKGDIKAAELSLTGVDLIIAWLVLLLAAYLIYYFSA